MNATTDFSYLAFDGSSGDLLTHGANPFVTLLAADRLAPTQPIEILRAGARGQAIWRGGLNRDRAAAMLDAA
jgi:hypothetical protein